MPRCPHDRNPKACQVCVSAEDDAEIADLRAKLELSLSLKEAAKQKTRDAEKGKRDAESRVEALELARDEAAPLIQVVRNIAPRKYERQAFEWQRDHLSPAPAEPRDASIQCMTGMHRDKCLMDDCVCSCHGKPPECGTCGGSREVPMELTRFDGPGTRTVRSACPTCCPFKGSERIPTPAEPTEGES